MSEALRSLLAEFVVQVDKAGELARGNEAVTALKARLVELQSEFAKVKAPAARAGKSVQQAFSGGFAGAPGLAEAMRAQSEQAAGNLFGMFGAAQGAQHRNGELVGPQREFGPTRETLDANNRAAAEYAKTLRGRLATAVSQVRKGLAGGGGEGPGLLSTLGTVRNGLVALGVGAAARAVVHLVDGIGDIRESAQKLGTTTSVFQRLKVFADQNGTSVEALGTAFRNLANVAVQPTKESTAALGKLGVSAKDANGQFKSTNDLFFEVAAGLADVSNETERSALAQDLLGRSAQELKPIFAGGRVEIEKQRKALAEMNVISEETINQADDLSDSWKAIGPQILSVAEPLIKVLLPALKDLTEWLVKWLKQTDYVATGLTALAYVLTANLIPALIGVVARGIAAEGSMLAFGAAAGKAAWSFARLIIGLLLLQDFIGFLRGDDSEIGALLDQLFGKGASTGVIEALAKAWDLLASSVKRVLEALHLLKPSDTDLEQRARADKTYEGSNFQTKIFPALKFLANAVVPGLGSLAGAGADAVASRTASADYGVSTIAAPGAPMSSGEANQSLAPNVSIGDSTVNITMGPSASAADVGSAVSSVQERGRDAILASYPQ